MCGTVSKRQKAAFCADSCGGGSEGGMWLRKMVFKQKYMVYQDKTKDKDKDDKDGFSVFRRPVFFYDKSRKFDISVILGILIFL